MMTTGELLGEYAELLNRFGVDSEQALEYLESHKDDSEFLELAKLSSKLKRALTAPGCNRIANFG